MKYVLYLLLPLSLFIGLPVAQADPGSRQKVFYAGNYRVDSQGREKAINRVRKQYPGKVLSAKPVNKLGPNIYRVKILSENGRVRSVMVDSETGRIFHRQNK